MSGPEVEQNNDERIEGIESRLDRLAESTTALRKSVESIQSPIQVHLQIQQERQAFEASAAKEAEARREREALAAKEKQAADEAARNRGRRFRRVILWFAFGGVTVLLLVTSLMLTMSIRYIDQLADEQRAAIARQEQAEARRDADQEQTRYASCLTRNAALQAQVRREQELARLGDEMGPLERATHAKSARELAKSLINCDQSYPRRSSK